MASEPTTPALSPAELLRQAAEQAPAVLPRAVAEPLAAWLESERVRLITTARPEWWDTIAPHALATAAAILQGAGTEGTETQ